MEPRTCAYPGCDVIYQPTNGRQRYHDRRESWRLSNRRWAEANREKKNALARAYNQTPEGFHRHYVGSRAWQLRQMRARALEELAALRQEEENA